jgi:2,4-dienoyl-CoA reductase-like NADH-dependent reductase (Old Yellow Enzyme family)
VKGKELRNRIVMPPMVGLRRLTTPEGVEWYGSHVRGGVGLVIVEATAVNRFGSELTAENMKPLVDAIHDGGALAAIQLFPVTFDFPRVGEPPTPNTVDLDEIEEIIANYRTATEVCAGAGFDGVEPHGAHNYLINQFFSPVQNGRTDAFGGSIENRMRFGLRIVESVHSACDGGMILLYRHTPVGQGYGIEESLILAEELVRAGVELLDISPSSDESPGDLAAPFKRFGVPVIAVGEMDMVGRALEVMAEDRADLVAVGRGLIADPEWSIKVREGRFDEIVECTKCDEKCFGNLRAGIPIECNEWP